MEAISRFLEQQPLFAFFLVIAAGYALGQIDIKGFSLGMGGVLFSGLLVGAISPKSQPPAFLGTLGIVVFQYGIGLHYGKQFFSGLASAKGIRFTVLTILSLLAAAAATVGIMRIQDVPIPMMTGLFAGSATTAPAMMAAIEASGSNDPAIGYTVAYPFGLVGPMLCMYFFLAVMKPAIKLTSQKRINTIEARVGSDQVLGMSIAELVNMLPKDVQILAVRSGNYNQLPNANHLLSARDTLLLGGDNRDSLDSACALIGQHMPGKIVSDRSHLDYARFFASRASVIGLPISEIKFPENVEVSIVQIRRGDADILPTPALTLEFGDRVGLLADRKHFPALRKFFGDSIRSTTEFSYIALGIGMVLGVVASIIPIPIPGIGTIKAGIAGGVLIVALILGRLGRTGSLTWTMPLSANLVLRNFGLSLFLAQIGMNSGEKFFASVQHTGISLLIIGVFILLSLVLFPLLIGHFLMRISADELLGITSGLSGNAAIVAYASKAVPSEHVEASFAQVYPAAMIAKILIAQALIAIWGT